MAQGLTYGNIVGFETGDSSECGATAGTFSVVSTPTAGTSSDFALRVNPTTTGTGYAEIRKSDAAGDFDNLGYTTIYVRFMFRYAVKSGSGTERIVEFRGTSSFKGTINLHADGRLRVIDKAGGIAGTGTTELLADTWYRIEFSSTVGAAGAYEVKIDGNVELSGNYDNNSLANYDLIRLGKTTNLNGQTVDYFYDDVAITSDGYPGPGEVAMLFPTDNGWYTNWTGSVTDVDERPHDGDTTFITTGTNGEFETFGHGTPASVGIAGTISTVKHFAIARYVTSSAARIALNCRSANMTGTDVTGGSAVPSSTYRMKFIIHNVNPVTTNPWTASALEFYQSGVKCTASQNIRVTQTGFMAEWIPSSLTTREQSEALIFTAVGAALGSYTRTPAENLTLTAPPSTLGTFFRTLAAPFTLSEGRIRQLIANRTGSASLALTSAVEGFRLFTRAVSDVFSLLANAARNLFAGRTASQDLILTELMQRGDAFLIGDQLWVSVFLMDAATGSIPQTGIPANHSGLVFTYTNKNGENTSTSLNVNNWVEIGGGQYKVFIDEQFVQGLVAFSITAPDLFPYAGAIRVYRRVLGEYQITWTYTVKDPSNQPIRDVAVWVTSDKQGRHIVAGPRLTNSAGVVTFGLDAGTYYVWSKKAGYKFSNPDTEVVS